MRAFVPVPGGWASELEPVELRLLGRVVADTAELLGERFDEAFFPVGIDPSSVPQLPADDADDDAEHGDEDETAEQAHEGDDAGSEEAQGAEEAEQTDAGGGEDAERAQTVADFDAIVAAQDWDSEDAEAPADPALARLFPPASVDDDELAAEMRRLTQGTLRNTKVAQLRALYEALAASRGIIMVRRGQESGWLAAMTDLRLVLASRLDISTDADAEALYERVADSGGRSREGSDDAAADDGAADDDGAEDELQAALANLYAAITWWQESLLEAMSRRP